MTAIGYIRVSTEEQARGGLSLQMQRSKIEAYCELHGLGAPIFFSDEGISGKAIAARPGLKALIERAVQSGQGTHVVIYKIDRIARNVRELLELVEKFDKAGVAFHSVCEHIDTKSATGRFFMTIIAAIAEWEAGVISERTRDVLQRKRDNGERLGAPRFGWKVVYGPDLDVRGRSMPHYVEIPEQQQCIERILKLNEQGISGRAIARELNVHRATVYKVIRKGAE